MADQRKVRVKKAFQIFSKWPSDEVRLLVIEGVTEREAEFEEGDELTFSWGGVDSRSMCWLVVDKNGKARTTMSARQLKLLDESKSLENI